MKTATKTTQLVGKISGEYKPIYLAKFAQYETQVLNRAQLEGRSERVINPTKICNPKWSWLLCMAKCLYSIAFKADTIALLPDWNKSKGAKIETACAVIFSKKIIIL